MLPDTHHDVTDLVIHGTVKNTKNLNISSNISFLRNKKIINQCLNDTFYELATKLKFLCFTSNEMLKEFDFKIPTLHCEYDVF